MQPFTSMRSQRVLVAALGAVAFTVFAAQQALALGVVETPAGGQVATGIGLVSGWHCTASRVEIRIDGGSPQLAASGTSRQDTATTCGRADTGFGLLLNFNLLDAGEHTLDAYADGALFSTATFTTTRYGAPYVTGLAGTFQLLHFPSLNTTTIVQWQEETQNFSIVGTTRAPRIEGTYFGALRTSIDCGDLARVALGTFTVTLVDSVLTVAASYADRTCVLSAAAVVTDGAVRSVPGSDNVSTCPELHDFQVMVDGLRITAFERNSGCADVRVAGAR